MVYSRAFLSFSKIKDQALRFLKKSTDEKLVSCIFEVKPLDEEPVKKNNDENEYYSSNAEIKNFSRFPTEDEVLFFPFSSFIITEIEDSVEKNIKVKRITLQYLGKFRKQINKIIQNINIEKLLEEKNKSQFLNDIKERMEKHIEEKNNNKKTVRNKREINLINKNNPNENETNEEIIDIIENNPKGNDKNTEIQFPLLSVNKIKQIVIEKIEKVIEDKKYQLIITFKKDKFIEFESKPNTLKYSEKLNINCFSDYSDNQFCIFTSVNKESLLVCINGDKHNVLLCYNLKALKDKEPFKIVAHEKNILCIRHFIKNNEDLILTTSYDNSLKIFNITNNWKEECFISNVGENKGVDNNYYLYSASLLTIENEQDEEKNEDLIIATCYNDDDIKIYDYKTKKIKKTIKCKFGFMFLDTYYDENSKKYYIICSNLIDKEINDRKEEQFTKIFDLETGNVYFEINKYAHNVIIRKLHNYTEENKNTENQIKNEVNNVSILFASNNKIYIYDFYNKNLLKEIEVQSVNYLHCICLWNKDYIIVGGDKKDNKIHIIDLNQNKEKTIYDYNVYTFAKIKEENKEKLYCQDLENQKFIIFKNEYIEEDI